MTTTTKTRSTTEPTAAEAWAARTYTATLDSGQEAEFRLPSIGEMAAFGDLPEDLLEIAMLEWDDPGAAVRMAAAPIVALTHDSPDEERQAADEKATDIAKRIGRYNLHLVSRALVNPKLTPAELATVPYSDVEMLSDLIMRRRGVDAAGRYVGVVPLDEFQVVLGAHGVGRCAPGCSACETARRELAAGE
jgi:hypothetical protein